MPVPTAEMAAEARRGLDWRREYGRGGTEVGVARARDIVNRRDLSMDTVGRMASYFARHEVDKQGQGWSPGEDGYPSAGRIAWALWGGDPGRAWAEQQLETDDDDEGGRQVAELIHARNVLLDAGDFEVRLADDGDGLTIAGYIARFGEPTMISDHLGEYTEEIARGAFARTIAERGPQRVRMQFDHGHDPLFGSLPIGVWTDLREDKLGLFGVGRILDDWRTIPIRAAIEAQALDGMSFRFKVVADKWRKGGGQPDHRTLREVALFEAGPVVNPAYQTTTLALRSAALELVRREFTGSTHAVEIAHRATEDAHGAIVDDEQVADPVVGIQRDHTPDGSSTELTRREMRLQALSRIGVLDDHANRSAA